MIIILARNDATAKAFADGTEYRLATQASHLFNAKHIEVMFDWESNKSTCDLKKMRTLLGVQMVNPLCKVVRHDKLVV